MWLLALTACSSAPPCELGGAVTVWPAEGQAGISTTASIELSLGGEVDLEQARVEVRAGGSTVQGQLQAWSGGLRWTPDGAMPSSQTIEWEAELCGQPLSGSFQTAELGGAPEHPKLLAGSYAIDLSRATWTQPPGGQVLFGQVFQGALLLGVQAVDEREIDLLGGGAQEVDGVLQQDPCVESFDFPVADYRNAPYVTVGPTTLWVEVQGIAAPIEDVWVQAAFSADGTALGEGRLDAHIDARQVAHAVGLSASQLCSLMESYLGVSCVACPSDGEERCLIVEIEDIDGSYVPGLIVRPNEDPQECSEDATR